MFHFLSSILCPSFRQLPLHICAILKHATNYTHTKHSGTSLGLTYCSKALMTKTVKSSSLVSLQQIWGQTRNVPLLTVYQASICCKILVTFNSHKQRKTKSYPQTWKRSSLTCSICGTVALSPNTCTNIEFNFSNLSLHVKSSPHPSSGNHLF